MSRRASILCINITPSPDPAKGRRSNGNFIGAETVLDHLKNGVTRRRVGFIVEGPPARGQYTLLYIHSS
jgi:hypothetical protein